MSYFVNPSNSSRDSGKPAGPNGQNGAAPVQNGAVPARNQAPVQNQAQPQNPEAPRTASRNANSGEGAPKVKIHINPVPLTQAPGYVPPKTAPAHPVRDAVVAGESFLEPEQAYTGSEPEQAPEQTDFSESEYTQPECSQPEYSQPEYSQPEYSQPEYSQPEYSQPDCSQPEYSQPDYSQPDYSQPDYSQPGYSQPGYFGAAQQSSAEGCNEEPAPEPVYDRYSKYADTSAAAGMQNGIPQTRTYGTADPNAVYGAYGAPEGTPEQAAAGFSWSGSTYSGKPASDNATDYRYNPYVAGYVSEPVIKRKNKTGPRRHLPKFVAVLLSAILFGVVAAGVFIGANEIYYRMYSDAAPNVLSTEHSAGSNNAAAAAPVTIGGGTESIGTTPVITDVSGSSTDVSAVVESAMPSIVQINCTFNVQSFFGYYESTGAGSGIILKKTDSELLIATNNHVIGNATSIEVTFCDGSTAPAITKGTDSMADLGVISINIDDLSDSAKKAIKVASLGNSDDIKVGQMVVAIGNAMGYGQSTTVGYISAKDREVTVEGNTMTLLQTDAAINPGNSGGALLNLKGEVIGINSVKYASAEVEGMGFAIPIMRAEAILTELSNRETLADEEKGYLGVSISTISASVAAAYNWPAGVYVADVTEGGAAEKGGIQVYDIITAVNGVTTPTTDDLRACVSSYRVGTTVTITLQRLIDGRYQELNLDVELGANPEYTSPDTGK